MSLRGKEHNHFLLDIEIRSLCANQKRRMSRVKAFLSRDMRLDFSQQGPAQTISEK